MPEKRAKQGLKAMSLLPNCLAIFQRRPESGRIAAIFLINGEMRGGSETLAVKLRL